VLFKRSLGHVRQHLIGASPSFDPGQDRVNPGLSLKPGMTWDDFVPEGKTPGSDLVRVVWGEDQAKPVFFPSQAETGNPIHIWFGNGPLQSTRIGPRMDQTGQNEWGLRLCLFDPQTKGIERDWGGLIPIQVKITINPLQSPSTEQGLIGGWGRLSWL
jgi:hypothetical protein